MDFELTEKGRRILEENCEEAFRIIDKRKIIELAREISSYNEKYLARLLIDNLKYHCSEMFPLKTEKGKKRRIVTGLQALLFYENLDYGSNMFFLSGGTGEYQTEFPFNFRGVRNFGVKSLELLEAYLVSEDLIKKE